MDLHGKPLLYYVYQRASRATSLERVLIATDDERVFHAATSFGADVVMTRGDHRSGTDRIAEAITGMDVDVIVNIQGDEPLIHPQSINHVVNLLRDDPSADMGTLKATIVEASDFYNPNVAKVVTDENDYALYFSRAPIPASRARSDSLQNRFRHIGLYSYRAEFLRRFTKWKPSPLELLEDLEQLRALEHGSKIKVGLSDSVVVGIDTPEDLDRVRKILGENPQLLEV